MLNYLHFLQLLLIFYPFCNCDDLSEESLSSKLVDDMKTPSHLTMDETKDLNSNAENKNNDSSSCDIINELDQELPRDCDELLFMEGKQKNGIYKIYPQGRKNPVRVYCDMETDGGGWTVIQRRGFFGEPRENFTRNWADYKKGFGTLREEFWLGNDLISLLTLQERMTLRIEFPIEGGKPRYAEYSDFTITGEDDEYAMTYSRFRGNVGDSLSFHKKEKFKTFESNACAFELGSGWWYRDDGDPFLCHFCSNLNGLLDTNNKACIYWFHLDDCTEEELYWDEVDECLKRKCLSNVEMKLRPQYSITREKINPI